MKHAHATVHRLVDRVRAADAARAYVTVAGLGIAAYLTGLFASAMPPVLALLLAVLLLYLTGHVAQDVRTTVRAAHVSASLRQLRIHAHAVELVRAAHDVNELRLDDPQHAALRRRTRDVVPLIDGSNR